MGERPRVLGLDIGTRRIGVAVTDPLWLTAQPILVVDARKQASALAEIGAQLDKYDATKVVFGLPLTLRGTHGPATTRTQDFVDALVKFRPGLTTIPWDERLTSAAAERALIEFNVSRARRKNVIDASAAALILQGWMDAQGNAL